MDVDSFVGYHMADALAFGFQEILSFITFSLALLTGFKYVEKKKGELFKTIQRKYVIAVIVAVQSIQLPISRNLRN